MGVESKFLLRWGGGGGESTALALLAVFRYLTLSAPTSQNGQTHSNNCD